jgi:hypothetical protein
VETFVLKINPTESLASKKCSDLGHWTPVIREKTGYHSSVYNGVGRNLLRYKFILGHRHQSLEEFGISKIK